MSNRKASTRRAALEGLMFGGAALAMAAADGLIGSATAEAAQTPSAASGPRPWTTGRIRRIVTGHNARGRSCVISDEMVEVGNMWITSGEEPLGALHTAVGQKVLPAAALAAEPRRAIQPTTAPNVDPPPGGVRWSISGHPPTTGPEKPATTNRIGRHRTATIDFAFVLGNGLVCVLDEQEVKLNQFDLIIQRNTDHAWRNDGPENVPFLITILRLNG